MSDKRLLGQLCKTDYCMHQSGTTQGKNANFLEARKSKLLILCCLDKYTLMLPICINFIKGHPCLNFLNIYIFYSSYYKNCSKNWAKSYHLFRFPTNNMLDALFAFIDQTPRTNLQSLEFRGNRKKHTFWKKHSCFKTWKS